MTIRYKKRLAIVGIMIFIVAVLVCTTYIQQHRKVVLKLGVFTGSPWGVPDAYTYEYIEDAISKFEEQNPNIVIEYVSGIQKEDYSAWLSGKLVGADAPDVFMVLPEDFSMLQRVGALKNLDSIIQADSSFKPEDYYQGAYEFGQADAHQYALPMECAPEMMFVNKSLLLRERIVVPDADWTWDEFYSICKAVTKDRDKNGVIDQFGVYDYNWEQAFITNGVKIFNDSGEICKLQGENVVESVDFLKKVEQLRNGTVITAQDFDLGNVAFMPLTLAEYRTYKPYPWSIKKFSNFDWECLPLPRGPHGKNVAKMNTILLGMNARTSYEDEAWKLMKMFCYDREIQAEIYKYRSGGAVVRDVLEKGNNFLIANQALAKDDSINIGMINKIMEGACCDDNFSNSTQIKQLVQNTVVDIINNDQNTSITLKKLQREINQKLKSE